MLLAEIDFVIYALQGLSDSIYSSFHPEEFRRAGVSPADLLFVYKRLYR